MSVEGRLVVRCLEFEWAVSLRVDFPSWSYPFDVFRKKPCSERPPDVHSCHCKLRLLIYLFCYLRLAHWLRFSLAHLDDAKGSLVATPTVNTGRKVPPDLICTISWLMQFTFWERILYLYISTKYRNLGKQCKAEH